MINEAAKKRIYADADVAAPVICPRLTFSRLISNIFPSSITQVDSSSLTSCGKSPARIGGWPFSPQLRCFFVIDTTMSLGLATKFIFSGTLICKNKKRNLCVYMFPRARIIHMWRCKRKLVWKETSSETYSSYRKSEKNSLYLKE